MEASSNSHDKQEFDDEGVVCCSRVDPVLMILLLKCRSMQNPIDCFKGSKICVHKLVTYFSWRDPGSEIVQGCLIDWLLAFGYSGQCLAFI